MATLEDQPCYTQMSDSSLVHTVESSLANVKRNNIVSNKMTKCSTSRPLRTGTGLKNRSETGAASETYISSSNNWARCRTF